MDTAPRETVPPDEVPDNLDAVSELEYVLADVARIEAIAAAAVDACAGLPRAGTPEKRRAMSRLYGLVSATAQAAEALHEDGQERVDRITAARRRAKQAAQDADIDVDALARAGSRRSTPKLRSHRAITRDARAAVDRIKLELDEWLAAVEDPLVAGAASTLHRTELDHKDAEHDLSVDLLEEASNFVFLVLNGAAIASHGGAVVPECPGLDGPDHPCGAPVHRGRSLCASCEASSAYNARSR